MKERKPPLRAKNCGPHDLLRQPKTVNPLAFERAAALFRAAGDLSRLRLLHRLDAGEACVSELAEASDTKITTLSQQLRVLYAERMVKRRREGKHIYYSLADEHIQELIRAALEHASELTVPESATATRHKGAPS